MTLATSAPPTSSGPVIVEPVGAIDAAPQMARRPSRIKSAAGTAAWAVVGFAVFVAIWQLATALSASVPSPAETGRELRALLSDPFHDGGPNDKGIGILVKNSLGRVLAGFFIAVVLGTPLGLAMGSSTRIWKAANPVIQVLRPVSPLAWFPLWLYALKEASTAGIWVIFITSVWPIVLNTAAGASSVPNDQRNVAKVFKLNRVAYVRHILVPHCLPNIVTGMRLAMGTGWMVIVAVEMMSNQSGIGGYVWEVYNALNLAKVAALVLIIGVVGLALDLVFLRIGRAVAHQEARS